MAMKTWEQIGKESRAKMRRQCARFAAPCPQCKRPIAVGDPIVQPFALNAERVNSFYGCWYCEDCGEYFQRGVDCGYLAARGPWLTVADSRAFEARPDVAAWLAESRRRSALLGRAGAEQATPEDFDPGPPVCPGCYALGDAPCASWCPDAAIERQRQEELERDGGDESDDDLLAEALAEGVDVEAEATRVRGVLLDAIHSYRRDRGIT